MLRSKNIDRICCLVLAVTLLLTVACMHASGDSDSRRMMGYEERLFDQARVHAIELVVDDWEGFLSTCTDEEYIVCSAVIDGEAYKNVGIRAKGNTSLSSVENYGNNRYSFKVEFDHYERGKTYHGLDKLSLNNLIQDKTWMKDYLAYTLMNRMGVAAPLCSFVQISVNGEVWGLYLAVEGVEDGFLRRNYGAGAGNLYKPDSMSFGGGRGNGGGFDMENFRERFQPEEAGEMDEMPPVAQDAPRRNFDPDQSLGRNGMSSSDVRLQYIDDDPQSYSNIFDNAKTDITEADQQRLIASLKALSAGKEIESVVDVEAVIRYLVVHQFLCNDDSYTGAMVHNYYLYEKDGMLSMIPWDYNLAFGAFNMGAASDATSVVNAPVDSPVSQGEMDLRPMVAWIFESEEYTRRYHEVYAEFAADVCESGWLEAEIERVSAMIAPYIQEDPTAFYSYEEFTAAIDALQAFCRLRGQSIAGQLDGTIPSTTDGQRTHADALVDASEIDLSAMGEFGGGGANGGMPGNDREMPFAGPGRPNAGVSSEDDSKVLDGLPEAPEGAEMPPAGAGRSTSEKDPHAPEGPPSVSDESEMPANEAEGMNR